jgi:hypothetical protein
MDVEVLLPGATLASLLFDMVSSPVGLVSPCCTMRPNLPEFISIRKVSYLEALIEPIADCKMKALPIETIPIFVFFRFPPPPFRRIMVSQASKPISTIGVPGNTIYMQLLRWLGKHYRRKIESIIERPGKTIVCCASGIPSHCSHRRQSLVGWYSFRKNSPLRPSMREINVHFRLCEMYLVEH